MLFARDSLVTHCAKATVFGHLTTPNRDDVAIWICGLKDILVELGVATSIPCCGVMVAAGCYIASVCVPFSDVVVGWR